MSKEIHVRLIIGTIRIASINLCEWGSQEIIRLPKQSQMKNITCEGCIKRWKEERE